MVFSGDRNILTRKSLTDLLGNEVEDASEETFLLFSHQLPSHSLGFTDPNAAELTISIGDREIDIRQSPGLLKSVRDAGTTGAVLWNISPLVASWLIDQSGLLWASDILHADASIVELGCGITGVLGILVSPFVSTYLLTDQNYVMKTLQQNIDSNRLRKAKSVKGKKGKHDREDLKKLQTLTLDWEHDSSTNMQYALGADVNIDLVVACDCIYNEFLISPFVSTCAELCQKILSAETKSPVLLVAQQLRSEEIFEEWLRTSMEVFHLWRIPDKYLSRDLQNGSGYVLHLGIVKDNRKKD